MHIETVIARTSTYAVLKVGGPVARESRNGSENNKPNLPVPFTTNFETVLTSLEKEPGCRNNGTVAAEHGDVP